MIVDSSCFWPAGSDTGSSSLIPTRSQTRCPDGIRPLIPSALRASAMPGIHFAEVRDRISLADVLDLLGFIPCESSGDQVRGPCPVHHSISPSSRCFSANLKRHIYRCFKCGSCGNQLDLYASATGLSLFEATVAVCEQLHREVPWMTHGTPLRSRPADRDIPQSRGGREPGRRAGSIPGGSNGSCRNH